MTKNESEQDARSEEREFGDSINPVALLITVWQMLSLLTLAHTQETQERKP